MSEFIVFACNMRYCGVLKNTLVQLARGSDSQVGVFHIRENGIYLEVEGRSQAFVPKMSEFIVFACNMRYCGVLKNTLVQLARGSDSQVGVFHIRENGIYLEVEGRSQAFVPSDRFDSYNYTETHSMVVNCALMENQLQLVSGYTNCDIVYKTADNRGHGLLTFSFSSLTLHYEVKLETWDTLRGGELSLNLEPGNLGYGRYRLEELFGMVAAMSKRYELAMFTVAQRTITLSPILVRMRYQKRFDESTAPIDALRSSILQMFSVDNNGPDEPNAVRLRVSILKLKIVIFAIYDTDPFASVNIGVHDDTTIFIALVSEGEIRNVYLLNEDHSHPC